MSYTLEVRQNAISGCSIVSVPAGIATTESAPGPITASFPVGTDVTLIATVGPGKFFTGWNSLDTLVNIQTSQTTITFRVNGSYRLKATFSDTSSENLDIFTERPRDYVPSQGERADAQHICQCPCACTGCAPVFTSSLNRTRQTRALISGDCCKFYPVGLIGTTGGSGYAVGDILQLQGGTPLEKPALFKVLMVSSGAIVQIEVIYGQPYRTRPGDDVLVPYTGNGSGGDFAVLWASCLSSANL